MKKRLHAPRNGTYPLNKCYSGWQVAHMYICTVSNRLKRINLHHCDRMKSQSASHKGVVAQFDLHARFTNRFIRRFVYLSFCNFVCLFFFRWEGKVKIWFCVKFTLIHVANDLRRTTPGYRKLNSLRKGRNYAYLVMINISCWVRAYREEKSNHCY